MELPGQDKSAGYLALPYSIRHTSVSNGFGHFTRHWEKQVLLSLYKVKRPTDRSPKSQIFSSEAPLPLLYFIMVY